MPKRLYFGHPVNTYNTDLEVRLLQQISEALPDWEIENPNQKCHQEGYDRWKESTGNGMKYFTEQVLQAVRAAYFSRFVMERGVPGYSVKQSFILIKVNLFG